MTQAQQLQSTGLTGAILVTGGSGTLGHAIVRTAEREGWDCSFTIYSRSELRQAQMRARHPRCRYVLGDVRDAGRTAAAIAGHDLVIHAAAMKRIPECEEQPAECYATNVLGSINVVRACIAGGVKRCVGISTDKACRAVTAYGASKLAMEALFQAQPGKPTAFSLVRYGNVVASNGSVIPLWRERAKQGQPILLTDARCTRFWMAPSEAVQLIVHAAHTYYSGVIVVPKMGALSLVEMAEIIAPGAESHETGLRSLEKIHEDLIHPEETAKEAHGYYWVRQPGGILGHSYTSDTAPRLTRDQFLTMLEEAESYA
jgi:UDP-N-acetylglucosamine 4,6-dehydratase/5-epimerase